MAGNDNQAALRLELQQQQQQQQLQLLLLLVLVAAEIAEVEGLIRNETNEVSLGYLLRRSLGL
jgi:hypothetical protein